MNFDFSGDQEQLRGTLRKWVGKDYDFDRRRKIAAAGGFSRAAYSELAELGLPGLYLPESLQGLGLGYTEGMIVMEEFGRGIVLEPFAHTLIVSILLTTYAGSDLQAEWGPKIAAGEILAVLAHQELGNRYRLGPCRTKASLSAGEWVLNGGKSLVPAGDQADALIVPAMADGRLALFLALRETSMSTQVYVTQDGSRAAEIKFTDTPAALLTLNGEIALEHGIDVGIAALCAEAVGVMDETLEATVEYLKTRRQFGQTLASFQALRHQVADMKMQLELARSMSYYATLNLGAPREERRRAASRAKYQLGLSMRHIGQHAVQLHGGIALTDEYIVSHYFKKLTQLEMTFGDTLHHLGEVAAHMQDQAGVVL